MGVTQSLCPLFLLLVASFVGNIKVNRVRISASVSVSVSVRDTVGRGLGFCVVRVRFRVWVRIVDGGSG